MDDSDNYREIRIGTGPGNGYALSGKIMLSAIIILFAVVVFMVCVHIYARWYLFRLRRRQEQQRQRRRVVSRTQIIRFVDNQVGSSAVDRGLELKVLNSLPYFLYSTKAEQQPRECAVCLSEFEGAEIVRLLPKCNHNFHIDCIDMWFHSHSTCPLCRTPVEMVLDSVLAINPAVGGGGEASPPGSSSGSGPCPPCRSQERIGDGDAASLGGRRKPPVRLEVPPRRTELGENELSQSSPAGRLLSRILSMGRRSPVGGGPTTACEAEVDLEHGVCESIGEARRVPTAM